MGSSSRAVSKAARSGALAGPDVGEEQAEHRKGQPRRVDRGVDQRDRRSAVRPPRLDVVGDQGQPAVDPATKVRVVGGIRQGQLQGRRRQGRLEVPMDRPEEQQRLRPQPARRDPLPGPFQDVRRSGQVPGLQSRLRLRHRATAAGLQVIGRGQRGGAGQHLRPEVGCAAVVGLQPGRLELVGELRVGIGRGQGQVVGPLLRILDDRPQPPDAPTDVPPARRPPGRRKRRADGVNRMRPSTSATMPAASASRSATSIVSAGHPTRPR